MGCYGAFGCRQGRLLMCPLLCPLLCVIRHGCDVLLQDTAYGAGYNSTGYQKTGMTGEPVNTDGFVTSAEYKRQHDIVVQGDHVPEPLQTFESVGFPRDVLEEVICRPVVVAVR